MVHNVQDSVALSHSLSLRRDLPRVLPGLKENGDTEMAQAWTEALVRDGILSSARAAEFINPTFVDSVAL